MLALTTVKAVCVLFLAAAAPVSAEKNAESSESDQLILSDGQEGKEQPAREKGLTIWMTGLSGSGKTTIAVEVVKRLKQMNKSAYRLDGDNLRKGLSSDLRFSTEDREENIRRASEVAKLFNDAGVIVVCALIAPFTAEREFARNIHGKDGLPYMEVFIDAPLKVVEARDPKGLYVLAHQGKIKEFTGLTSPYEAPTNPDVHIKTADQTVEESVQTLMAAIATRLKAEVAKDSCEKKNGREDL